MQQSKRGCITVTAKLVKKAVERKMWSLFIVSLYAQEHQCAPHNLFLIPINAYTVPAIIIRTPAIEKAGVILGWRGRLVGSV